MPRVCPGNWQTLVVSGSATAVVRNLSGVAVAGPFEVAFFEDRDGDGVLGTADATLGRATVDGLGAFASVPVEASLSGSLLFRGSPVRAFADSGGAVPESDESNNVGRTGETCQVRPSGPPWSLREEWASGSGNLVSTPAVGDLDGDGVADVVFVTARAISTLTDGQLQAVNGRGGSQRFAITDRDLDVNPSASPALGDIDGDGRPEIVAVTERGPQILAFEADGTFKWRSPTLLASVGAAAPFLADLDGDGRAEILVGRQVLNGDGTLRWTGAGTMSGRSGVTGTHSVAADLDLDGTPEVIAGASAYRADGTLLWSVPAVGDGVVAVGNLDSDPYPEIVVSTGALWRLEHDGTVVWGPIEVPGAAYAGPVTLADFDGDGRLEIGVGTRLSYSVFESYGHTLWTVDTAQADGHFSTGGAASAFDFDGDGAAEVVLADSEGLRVLRGRDGSVVAESPTGTCTNSHATPVVADVDGDAKAEILLGSNATCTASTARGLRAFGEAGDRLGARAADLEPVRVQRLGRAGRPQVAVAGGVRPAPGEHLARERGERRVGVRFRRPDGVPRAAERGGDGLPLHGPRGQRRHRPRRPRRPGGALQRGPAPRLSRSWRRRSPRGPSRRARTRT